eukprot:m.43489 g.43489  ORF g.43489 m.43489 type:complete len:150 (+) comp12928_c0_seq2:1046-1495(+)
MHVLDVLFWTGLNGGHGLDLLLATYQRETILFEHKKNNANAMRKAAERDYQKLLTKKKGMLSSLRLAHSDSPFLVEASMAEAKQALASVIEDARERQRRWARLQDLFDLDLDGTGSSGTNSFKSVSRKDKSTKLRRRAREEELAQELLD